MKLKYKVGLILLPLIIIITYQVQSYRDFSKDIDNLRETVVIPATEEALLSANIQFLSAQLSTSLQRAIIALQSGHEKGVKEAIQKNILTREQRQVELQKLREVSTEFLLQEDKLSTQLAKDMENLITKVDNLNERITSEIAASSGTAEQINRISRKVNSELAPFENKLFFTLTVVLENSVSKVAETRKIFTEVKKRGVQKLYLVSILSLIVFISIVLFLNFWIVNPIKKLTKGAEIIGKGELEHKIDIKSKDEIGELSTAFNQMTENLKVVTASRDDLNKEIAERKKAEEGVAHLNAVLRAIRNVNQLIAKEKDRDRLLQGACDSLLETRGYFSAWIALLDNSGKLLATTESGLKEAFLPMVELFKRGELPVCGTRALTQSEVVAIEDPSATCIDCPLILEYPDSGSMTVRLEHGGKVYGMMAITIPREMVADQQEQALFHEVADDLAFALHSIELEEEHKRAEEALRERTYDLEERVKEINCLYSVSKLAVESDRLLDEVFQGAANLIPPSWQHPDITCVRIVFEGHEFTTENFIETEWKQSADIIVSGEKAGAVEVYYLEEKPEADKGPFLKEERELINALAREMGKFAERRHAEEELRQHREHLEELVEERTKELRDAQEQLVRTEKLAAIGQLASGVGHELRNPLGVIGNSAYYLNTKLKDADEKVIKHVSILQREVHRANKIITDLLDFSRVKPPSLEKSDVNSIVKDTLAEIKVPENISIETQLDGKLPRIPFDPDQIRQVFLNIISNALGVMPEGGRLNIKTGVKGDFAEITLKDTGEGIPKENLKKIFDPLFTTKARGIGLGLSIVKGMIDSHKGLIEVKSKVGKGTAFTVKLPFGLKIDD